VDRPTNCSKDRQGLRRFKDIHRPKRNPKRGYIKKTYRMIQLLSDLFSIGSGLHVLIVAARWFDIATLKCWIAFPTAQVRTNVSSSNEGQLLDIPLVPITVWFALTRHS